MASVFPSRYSADRHDYSRESYWEGIPFLFLTGNSNYYRNKILRFFQILSGQFMGLIYITLNLKRMSHAYFYCPRFIDTLPLLLYLKIWGKKIIVDQTELFSSLATPRIHRLEEKLIAKYSDVLLVISNKLKEHFETSYNPKSLYRFPVMVDFKRFDRSREPEKFMLGYLGSFDKKDGVREILYALSELIEQYPKMRLKLIGFNQYKEQYINLITELGLNDHVIMTGKVSYESIPMELLECETLIINRTSDPFSTYGYPIKLAEYFASERTVLISDIPGYAEDLEDGNQVYKYTPDSVSALVECVTRRYRNSGESDAVAKRGREYAEHYFDAETNGLLLKNIISDLR